MFVAVGASICSWVNREQESVVTKEEWLACIEPGSMLTFVLGRASERKSRLFTVACCRNVWHRLADERSRNAVEFAESYADGLGQEDRLTAVRLAASSASREDPGNPLARGVILAVSRSSRHITSFVRWGGAIHCDFLRDIFGPLAFGSIDIDPLLLTGTVLALAQVAYDERQMPSGILDNQRLAVLADALEESGCTDPEVLGHLRDKDAVHVRGCFALDLILRKS